MKKMACTLAAVCILSAPALANDRTEDGTAASRNAEVQMEMSGTFNTVPASAAPGVPYVNPAGRYSYEPLYQRYSRGHINGNDFIILKRQSIEPDSHAD